MDSFKQHLKDNKDIDEIIASLPKAFQKLVHGFHIKLEPGNTLSGDDKHVGVVQTNPKKQIRVASPWNYARSFGVLHEISHLIYEKYVKGTKWEKEWKEIVKKNPNRKKDEPDEENWCHNFANHFIKYPMIAHTCSEWENYLKKFLKQFN